MRLDLQLRLFSTTKLPVSPGSTAPPRLLRQLDQRLADARPAALHRRRVSRPVPDRERDAIARDLALRDRLAELTVLEHGLVKGPVDTLHEIVEVLDRPGAPRPRPAPPSRITAHTTTLRCEGGAWGLADRCRHHEGEPLDARGLCRWGCLAEQEQG